MARGDKTGPMGQGSMTGRSLGYCSGNENPGFTSGFGGGRGQGRGIRGRGGRGRGFAFKARYSNETQVNSNNEIIRLKAQAESLKKAQEEIDRRLKDLENN